MQMPGGFQSRFDTQQTGEMLTIVAWGFILFIAIGLLGEIYRRADWPRNKTCPWCKKRFFITFNFLRHWATAHENIVCMRAIAGQHLKAGDPVTLVNGIAFKVPTPDTSRPIQPSRFGEIRFNQNGETV